jgi:hypothetical protein
MKKQLLILASALCLSLGAQAQAVLDEPFTGTAVPPGWGANTGSTPPTYSALTANDKLIVTMTDSNGPQQLHGVSAPDKYDNFYYAVAVADAVDMSVGCKCLTFDVNNSGNAIMSLYVQAGDYQQNVGGVYNHYTDNTFVTIAANYVGPVTVFFSGSFKNNYGGGGLLDSTKIKSFDFQPVGYDLGVAPWHAKFKGNFTIDNFRIAPAPEINVKNGTTAGTSVASGGTATLTDVVVGSTGSAQTITIENTGLYALSLASITKSGTDASMFTLAGLPGSFPASIPAGASQSFTVTFAPTSVGAKTATITIGNSDADEGTYTVVLTADGISPEINVKKGATSIASAGTVSLADVVVNTTGTAEVFTIENTGSAALTISSITKSGTNAADFTIGSSLTTIGTSGSGTFTLTFAPTTIGNGKTVTLTIANNDTDEGSYTIIVTANSVATAAPEINVKKGATSIASAGTAALTDVASGSTGTAEVFTIENTGSAALTIASITKSGANASEFTIGTAPTSIAAAGTATFTVTFAPTSVATGKTVTITINNNDSDEGNYTLVLTANGTTGPTAVSAAQANISSSKLYPNPTSDMANVELNLKSSSEVKVILSDLMGKEVMTIATGTMSSLNESFSVANLNKGIYTVSYFINGSAAKAELLMVK